MTGGLVLLGWFTYLWIKPLPAPYDYQLIAEGDGRQLSKMGLEGWPELQLNQYKVQADGVDKPIADSPLQNKTTDHRRY